MHVGIANPRWRGNRPRIPGACAFCNFTYLARSPSNLKRAADISWNGRRDLMQFHGTLKVNPVETTNIPFEINPEKRKHKCQTNLFLLFHYDVMAWKQHCWVLRWESTSNRRISLTVIRHLIFSFCQLELCVGHIFEMPVIWDNKALMWRQHHAIGYALNDW